MTILAERVDAVDRAGILSFRGMKSLQPARQLILGVRSQRIPVKARLVELRYFAGLTGAEAADALGISTATAKRSWTYARAWLRRKIATP